MIVVSGEPRSGTSLQMLIIKKLGFEITGFRDSNYGKGRRFNPSGIWEIDGVPNHGLTKNLFMHNRIEGDVIKLTTFGLLNSDPSFINKLIYCIRDPREVIVSQRGQVGYTDDDWNWNEYITNIKQLLDKIEPNDWDHIHIVDYKDVISNRRGEVQLLADFLDVEFRQSAVSVIKTKYYRSKPKVAWNQEAKELYEILRSKKRKEIINWKQSAKAATN